MSTYRAVCYVAGPFRGPSAWHVAENVRNAERVAFEVWEMGITALCPHANTAHFDRALPDEAFLEGTMELLRRSDMVLVCPGWETSVGTMAEIQAATNIGIPVFYADREGWQGRLKASARAAAAEGVRCDG